ncbi:MAG: type II toxin-antitoxin system death-on-curing family toxin [Proteobacteria bacterium]|nr:type II toxin-antitoxin system death-on-curing family toxin [Pseudomonadota bacterium]
MTPKEPTWVRLDAVLAIHRRQLSEHGGLDGIRDQGMLESALGRPTNKYSYESPKPSLAQLAAAYAFGIAKNHPFIDGNKRTAFVVCELFLRLNKQGLEASAEGKYIIFLSLADGTLSEEALAQWIAEHLISRI